MYNVNLITSKTQKKKKIKIKRMCCFVARTKFQPRSGHWVTICPLKHETAFWASSLDFQTDCVIVLQKNTYIQKLAQL